MTPSRSSFPVTQFYRTEMIDQYLTVAGESGRGSTTTILNQSSTILWYTCGNMVTTTTEVARFFWSLLGPRDENNILAASTVASMEHFVPLSQVGSHTLPCDQINKKSK